MYTHIHTYTHHIQTRIHAHTCAQTHTHTHTHTHIRIQMCTNTHAHCSVKALTVGGDDVCPIIHLRLSKTMSNDVAAKLLQDVADECIVNGVAVVTSKYLDEESPPPPPRLELILTHWQCMVTAILFSV